MFDKAYDWMRVAQLDAEVDLVEKTKTAIKTFTKESENITNVIPLSIAGLVDKKPDLSSNAAAKGLLAQLRTARPELSSDLDKNVTLLRVCFALFLGEQLQSGEREPKHCSAGCIVSSLNFRTASKVKHLDEIYGDLIANAQSTLNKEALSAREEVDVDDVDLEDNDDVAKLSGIVASLVRQARVDREEMNLMWWLSSGFSNKAECCVFDLNAVNAALIAAIETAAIVLTPPMHASLHVLRRLIAKNFETVELSAKEISTQIDEAVLTLAVESGDSQIFGLFPSVFPLSWLFLRLKESRGTASWTKEFDARTTLETKDRHLIQDWAGQLYWERVALRMLEAESADDDDE